MSEGIIGDLLRRVPLFADLPPAELDQVVRAARPIPRRKGARVFEEGSTSDCCLVLTSGRAKVVLSGAKESEFTLGVIEPFTLVGELGVLDGSTRSASLVALEDCNFIRIPAPAITVLRRNAAFADKLVAHLAATIRKANDQLRAIYTFKVDDRVIWSLARLAGQQGVSKSGDIIIEPRPTHQELAEMTGCSRETVSRALLNLRRKKFVSWDAGSLRLDTGALQRRVAARFALSDVTEITRLV